MCGRNPHIAPAVVQSDIDELKNVSHRIEEFSDRRIAHLDKRFIDPETGDLPTFKELDECIEKMDQLAVRYRLDLTAMGGITMYPEPQFNWRSVFYELWIKEVSGPLIVKAAVGR